MFFYLSKVGGFLAQPSNALVLLGVAGLLLMLTRFHRFGRRLVVGAFALIVALAVSPLGSMMTAVLEDRFPPWREPGPPPAGFIVLGGAIDADLSRARGQPALIGSAERLTVLADLARRYSDARIVVSGGRGSLLPGTAVEADTAGRLLESFGIARERILLEPRSRTTAENAAYTKAMLEPKPGERWVLVTSAVHMPRAVGAFRRAGFPVEAHPVDWRTAGSGTLFDPHGGLLGGLARIDYAWHEWLGLAAYWLSGRSADLFPGPSRSGG